MSGGIPTLQQLDGLITDQVVDQYWERGYWISPKLFSDAEIDRLRAAHGDPAARPALGADGQDGRDHRQPRDGFGEGAQRDLVEGPPPGRGGGLVACGDDITTGAGRASII